MKHNKLILILLMAMPLLFVGCHSSKNAGNKIEKTVNKGDDAYKLRVISNMQTAKAVTAKMKVTMDMGGRDMTLSGNLKMKRDDVIQLSLTFLGMEVGRLEFAKNDVTVIDRMKRRYARVAYSRVDFLQSANLDFNALQSLFWAELFVPGTADISKALSEFTVASSGDHTLLHLATAPKLDYTFLSKTVDALLVRTTIKPKGAAISDCLECRYTDYVNLGGHRFPLGLHLMFKGDKQYGLDMMLSSLNNNENWEAHTEISSKYTEIDVDQLLKGLGSLDF